MSINSAMLAGVSGLSANSTALSTVSENIVNANTVGYKQKTTDFQTFLSASGSFSAGGVQTNNRQQVSETGLLQQTNSKTDLGIDGQGFFVVTQKAENLTEADSRMFTRAGSFTLDADGYLQNAAGLYLQGWLPDANGDFQINPADLSKLSSINVNNVGGTAAPTSRIGLNANLDAATFADPAGPTRDLAAMESYAADPTTGVKPDFTIPLSVYDSQGGKHTLSLNLLKDSTAPNQWFAEIRSAQLTAGPPPTYEAGDPALGPGVIGSGLVAFNTDGSIDKTLTTLPSVYPSGTSAPITWDPSLGLAAQPLQLDFDTFPGGLTQSFASSVVQSVTSNGTSFGGLSGIEIDNSGNVVANFNNGVSRTIAKVALATFPNPNGLQAVSGTAYRISIDSGPFNLKAPGTGGAGLLSASTLEASTVDLSSEFTKMITTQRAYSACSKIITTADDMLQELLNIKR